MREAAENPQINMSKMPVGTGVAGAIFAVASTVIFLVGIPALRYFLPAAAVIGVGIAFVVRRIRRETPSRKLYC